MAGTRTVPVPAVLSDHLLELKARTPGGPDDFVFPSDPKRSRGKSGSGPFTPSYVTKLAADAWKTENEKRAEKELPPLVPIGLHELRRTNVTLLHDAGLSLEAIGDIVGHSSVYMTSRYRHLLEGHEDRARKLMDEYLARADTASRIEQLEDED